MLAARGQAIVSIPNIANITTRLLLLAGRFDYTEKGLLDRTHLRFYTRTTARRLLEENGYEILREEMTNIPVELGLHLAPSSGLVRGMHRVLAVATRLFPGLLGYQTMFVARKAPREEDR